MEPARPESDLPLKGRRVALPETRELEILEGLFRRRGADVFRCPLVGIVDSPDGEAVTGWLQEFIDTPPDFLILMTGEGVRRLLGFVGRSELSHAGFIRSLKATTIIARGPKPVRALRLLGVGEAHVPADATTAGIMQFLDGIELRGKRVGVQLYGDDPNEVLMRYLLGRGAVTEVVAPYRYVPASSDDTIAELIGELAGGRIDVIVFTSKTQVERLFGLAAKSGRQADLDAGLDRTRIAAIGPLVVQALHDLGWQCDIAPPDRYFMKPLVAEVCRAYRS
jgi:uroporphyrinogen-III synthase